MYIVLYIVSCKENESSNDSIINKNFKNTKEIDSAIVFNNLPDNLNNKETNLQVIYKLLYINSDSELQYFRETFSERIISY